MEFTVSKSDLVRELGLTQGVVERKTTIPFSRTSWWKPIKIRSGSPPLIWNWAFVALARRASRRKAPAPFRRAACSITCACCPMPMCRSSSPKTTGPALFAAVRARALPACRAKAFRAAGNARTARQNSARRPGADDQQHHLRDFVRGVALHFEWRAAAVA